MALYDPKIVNVSSFDSYWAAQGTVAGTTITSQSSPVNVGCAVCTVHWNRVVPSGLREDQCAVSFHIAKAVSSDRETPSLSDLATIEPFLTTWISAMAVFQDNQYTAVDITYHFRNAAALRDGPAVKRTAITTVGAVTNSRLPDQDSMTVTIATPSRKHWGRIYYPGISVSNLDLTYGRWINAACTGAGNATDALASSLNGAGFALGVWSKIGQAFLDVYGVHVDNVVDIQRRRRAKQRSFIAVHGN